MADVKEVIACVLLQDFYGFMSHIQVVNLFEFIFVWCEKVTQFHSSACCCPVLPAPFVEETFFSIGILSFVKDQLTIQLWVTKFFELNFFPCIFIEERFFSSEIKTCNFFPPDSPENDIPMEIATAEPQVSEAVYDCVICGQSGPSSEDRPTGLVVLLQASSGKIKVIFWWEHFRAKVYTTD